MPHENLAFFAAVLLALALAGGHFAEAQPIEGTWVPAAAEALASEALASEAIASSASPVGLASEAAPTLRVEEDVLFWTIEKEGFCVVRRMEVQWKGSRAVTTAPAQPTWTIDLSGERNTAYVTYDGKTLLYRRVFESKIDDCRVEAGAPR